MLPNKSTPWGADLMTEYSTGVLHLGIYIKRTCHDKEYWLSLTTLYPHTQPAGGVWAPLALGGQPCQHGDGHAVDVAGRGGDRGSARFQGWGCI